MTFGGENTTVGVSAHLHTNSTGEGGALDSTTLLNTDTLETSILVLG